MLDKKYLKKLYNINQDIKKVFEVYYVFNNGVILSSGKDVQKGIVINTDLFKDLLDNSDNVIVINSLLLFEIFKKFKISQIEGIEIRDSKIGAIADGEFQIFAIYKPINDKILSLYSLNSPYIENNYMLFKELLNSNACIILKDNKAISLYNTIDNLFSDEENTNIIIDNAYKKSIQNNIILSQIIEIINKYI